MGIVVFMRAVAMDCIVFLTKPTSHRSTFTSLPVWRMASFLCCLWRRWNGCLCWFTLYCCFRTIPGKSFSKSFMHFSTYPQILAHSITFGWKHALAIPVRQTNLHFSHNKINLQRQYFDIHPFLTFGLALVPNQRKVQVFAVFVANTDNPKKVCQDGNNQLSPLTKGKKTFPSFVNLRPLLT